MNFLEENPKRHLVLQVILLVIIATTFGYLTVVSLRLTEDRYRGVDQLAQVSVSGNVMPPGSGWVGPSSQPPARGTGLGANRIPIADWDFVPYRTITQPTRIGLVAWHINDAGIERVEFSLNGGTPVSVTTPSLNPDSGVVEYFATLDPSLVNGTDVAEVRATVYPVVGVPKVLPPLELRVRGTDSRLVHVQCAPGQVVQSKPAVASNQIVWYENCNLVGAGIEWGGDHPFSVPDRSYFTGGSISYVHNAAKDARLVRGVTIHNIGSDALTGTDTVINTVFRDSTPCCGAHPDVYQSYSDSNDIILYGVIATQGVTGSQGFFAGGNWDRENIALVDTTIYPTGYESLVIGRVWKNIIIKNSIFGPNSRWVSEGCSGTNCWDHSNAIDFVIEDSCIIPALGQPPGYTGNGDGVTYRGNNTCTNLPSTPQTPQLSISPSTFTFVKSSTGVTPASASMQISVPPGVGWTLRDQSQYIDVTPTSGTGPTTVEVRPNSNASTATANNSVVGTVMSGTSVVSYTLNLDVNTQAPPQYTVSVTKSGNGQGVVQSSPAGVNCGSQCSSLFSGGSTVILTAAPLQGSTFTGWSGVCQGSALVCSLAVNENKSVTAIFTTPTTNPQTGRVLWWPLENIDFSNGAYNDRIANSKLNIFGGYKQTQTKVGGGVQFDGTSAYGRSSATLPAGDFTWVVRFNPSRVNTFQMLFGGGDGTELNINDQGKIDLWLNGQQVISNAGSVTRGRMQTLAVTRSGATVSVLKNGSVLATGTYSGPVNSPCGITLGADTDGGCTSNWNGYFYGVVDDIQVYNYQLTTTEIRTLGDSFNKKSMFATAFDALMSLLNF